MSRMSYLNGFLKVASEVGSKVETLGRPIGNSRLAELLNIARNNPYDNVEFSDDDIKDIKKALRNKKYYPSDLRQYINEQKRWWILDAIEHPNANQEERWSKKTSDILDYYYWHGDKFRKDLKQIFKDNPKFRNAAIKYIRDGINKDLQYLSSNPEELTVKTLRS